MTDPREDDLIALYRRLPRPEPPAALDAAVLGAARAAVRPRRPAWLAPVAAAAAMVLAVGVGWQLRHEPLRETTPAVAPAAAPAPEPAALAESAVAADATPDDAKAEPTVADLPEPAPLPPIAPPPAAADATAAATAGATATAAEVRPPRPAESKPEADLERQQERLEEITVTGNRVAAPRQRAVATQAFEESLAAPAPPVADTVAVPPPPPAPAPPPVPAEPLSPAAAPAAAKSLSSERAAGAPARTDAAAIAAAFDEIRALRDAGRRDEAADALARLLDEHPALEVPGDLRDLRR